MVTSVDLAALCFQEHLVRRQWAVDGELLPCERLYRRTNDVDFISAEIPAVAGMEIQRRHRDSRPPQTGSPEHPVNQCDGLGNPLLRDTVCDLRSAMWLVPRLVRNPSSVLSSDARLRTPSLAAM